MGWKTSISSWLHLDAITWCCQELRWQLGVDSEGGVRGGWGKGDIEFHAPVRLRSAAALRHTMAPVEWARIGVAPLPSGLNKNFGNKRKKKKKKKHKLFFGKLKKSGFSFWKFSKFQIVLSCRHACCKVCGESLKSRGRSALISGLLSNEGAALCGFPSAAVSVSASSCCQLAPLRYLHVLQCRLSSHRDADQIGPAAVPVSSPPLPPPRRSGPPSSGLLLHAEGNKDTRRISVVRPTKWLPESVRAMPMGSTASPRSCAPSRRSPPPPCLGFPKVRSLSGSSVDMR